jgi:hypothetical protein
MQVGSQWHNRIDSEIDQYRVSLGPKGAKSYRLDTLLRVAKRVDDFSQTCGECQTYQKEIEGLVQELGLITQVPDKESRKKYTAAIDRIIEHLKKTHKLVDKGHYMGVGIGIGMAIGAGMGAALGAIVNNPGIGSGIGIAFGVAVGAYLDRKADREGRVI